MMLIPVQTITLLKLAVATYSNYIISNMGSPQEIVLKDTEFLEAEVQVYNYVFNFVSSMSLKCAVQLGIPDIIHNHANKPVTLSNLVDALSLPSTKTEYVHRLMRFLVHTGCFAHVEEGYLLTPLSRLFLKDANNSMSSFLLANLDPFFVTPWHFISTWLQGSSSTTTSTTATNNSSMQTSIFEFAHGMDIWNLTEKNSEFNKTFNKAMACDTRLVMNSVINDPKIGEMVFNKNLKTLIDVAGGVGTAAISIAEAYPHLKCSVLDLPHVVAAATEVPRTNNVIDIEYIGGDMFEFIPHTDAIFLKFILHDWSDESCLKLLEKCREAILPSKEIGGKLIIVDIVVEDRKEEQERTHAQYLFDMVMMVDTVGKERNEKQWEYLFLKSGFSHYKITSLLGSVRSLIEVYP